MFDTVQRPGSPSAELAAMTTSEMLAAYQEVCPSLPGLLFDMKEQALKRDAMYSTILRVNGCLFWLAMLGALWAVLMKH
jgi:hypothetical protein